MFPIFVAIFLHAKERNDGVYCALETSTKSNDIILVIILRILSEIYRHSSAIELRKFVTAL